MEVKKTLLMLSLASIIFFIFMWYSKANPNAKSKDSIKPKTETLTNSPSISEEFKGKRIEYSYMDSPQYTGLEFADDLVYQMLKKSYSKINFYGEFEKCNLEDYDHYKEKYHQLLKNQVNFINQKTGEEEYISNYGYLRIDSESDLDLNSYSYIVFDMDGDGMPELCITDDMNFYYVFRYISNTDQIALWCELESSYYGLIGKKKFIQIHLTNNMYFIC